MKINKRDLILDSIISAYLDVGSPIGSNELMGRLIEPIAASTIRVYLKQLTNDGAITQLHISGGRIPTERAMQIYWASRLVVDATFVAPEREVLELLVDDFGLYCMIFGTLNPPLKEVINYKNRFLLLDFGKMILSVRYDARIEGFLTNLILTPLSELEMIAAQVGFGELRVAISQYKMGQIFFLQNEQIAMQIYPDRRFKQILRPDFVRHFNGRKIAFDELFGRGFMGLYVDGVFEGEPAKMLIAGSIYSDFNKFLSNFKEVA